jgi:maltose/moltooligosaccharide transporter
VRIAFYTGGAGLLLAVMWTVFTTKEYSPSELAAFERAENADRLQDAVADLKRSDPSIGAYHLLGFGGLLSGLGLAILVWATRLEKELYVLAGLLAVFGLAGIVGARLKRSSRTDNGFSEVLEDAFLMPATMRQLAVVQFFSWFGLFAMWIYTTPAVAAAHFHAVDATSKAYNEGADWVGVLFAVYNGVAALAALLIPTMVRLTNRRISHAACLALGALGLLSIPLIKDAGLLWISMIGVGFAWSSILSAPYSILAGALPARKMGVYMGIFNFFIVIPQLLAATVLGLLLKTFFGGQAIYALVLGAVSFAIAAISVFAVIDPDEAPARA